MVVVKFPHGLEVADKNSENKLSRLSSPLPPHCADFTSGVMGVLLVWDDLKIPQKNSGRKLIALEVQMLVGLGLVAGTKRDTVFPAFLESIFPLIALPTFSITELFPICAFATDATTLRAAIRLTCFLEPMPKTPRTWFPKAGSRRAKAIPLHCLPNCGQEEKRITPPR